MAQPTLQTKLYYTCKVWGVAKYYHSRVSVCQVNWDSVLVAMLPKVKAAVTTADFNDVLDSMLAAAGPMAPGSLPAPATLPIELRRNLNFGWFNDADLRSDVTATLTNIKDNFRPHAGCWVQNNTGTGSYYGWLVFPHDSLMLDLNTSVTFPTEYQRLLLLCKQWNLVNYFSPYNYMLTKPWDDVLKDYVIPFDTVSSAQSLYYQIEKLTAHMDDVHVEGFTYSTAYQRIPGYAMPPLCLTVASGQYVVARSLAPGISPGDAIISVDGRTTQQWEDSLKQYISAGSASALKREVAQRLLGRMSNGTMETVVIEDSTGARNTYIFSCQFANSTSYPFYYDHFYPADSLGTIAWTTLRCDIGYVNVANLLETDVAAMYADLKDKPAIVFDMRQYPDGNMTEVMDRIRPNTTVPFVKFTEPDPEYPGTFSWYTSYLSNTANPSPYTGRIIVLMDEHTQSHGEFYTMALETMPDVVKVGTHTVGADGNISYWKLTQDNYTGFTTLGTFYPNGDSTQRVGLQPDVVAAPTRAGIRHKQDEVLERGMMEAGCFPVGIKNTQLGAVSIYPNPTTGIINIGMPANQQGKLQLADMTGKILLTKDLQGGTQQVDMTALPGGVYMLSVTMESGVTYRKIVKQ